MTKPLPRPSFLWRIMRRLNPFISRRFRSERKIGPPVLVLITTGRKSGRPHKTPLQYELLDGTYYVGSARGTQADWYRNILGDPKVTVEIAGREFTAQAEAITDPVRIADFLEMRLERHPKMIGAMMRFEGLPAVFSRAELEEFVSHKALVALHRI
jgi:deazaflavin-dependent oxidoreductase (nitroreductase family)